MRELGALVHEVAKTQRVVCLISQTTWPKRPLSPGTNAPPVAEKGVDMWVYPWTARRLERLTRFRESRCKLISFQTARLPLLLLVLRIFCAQIS